MENNINIMNKRGGKLMIKTLSRYIKEFKTASIITPICMIVEVIMETLIPFMMGSIVDNGIKKSDMNHVVQVGIIMIILENDVFILKMA